MTGTPAQFKRGDKVTMANLSGDFRVMAVADGYAMLRRPGCIPFVARLKDLRPALTSSQADG